MADMRMFSSDAVARALGVLSAGLGAPMVARPDVVDRIAGIDPSRVRRLVTMAVGVREFGAATGLLLRPGPAWLWARVAGDAMDLGALGTALANHDRRDHRWRRTVGATAVIAGIAAVDLAAALVRTRRGTTVEMTGATTVLKPADEVYDYWHRWENFSTFMAHVEEVRTSGPRASHWVVRAPLGTVEWDAETTQDVRGEIIGWRSTDSAQIPNEGEVRFRAAPGGRGTEVHVRIRYQMPAGRIGAAVARLLGEHPSQQLDDDLRRLKQVLETGEVVRSDGAPGGKRARREFPQHAAAPLTREELETEVSR
jgi:uncharacterized membrane protein